MILREALILFLTIIISNISLSQDKKLLRIEIETRSDIYPYQLISLEKDGMVIFYKTVKDNESDAIWRFDFYDVHLNKQQTKEIHLADNLSYKKDIIKADTVYILFQEESKKGTGNNYNIVIFDIPDKNFKKINGLFAERAVINDFKIFANKAYFNCEVGDEYSTLLVRDLYSDKAKDCFYEDRDVIEIDNIIFDTLSNSLNIILSKAIDKKEDALYFYKLDMDGSFSDSLRIMSGSEEKYLNKGMLYINSKDEMTIIGTYILSPGQTSKGPNEDDNESSGIFFTRIINKVQQNIKYYSYLDFKNFSVYISDNDFLKYKRQAKKREKKGKDFSINYNLLVHDIILHNDQYIFAAEAYYPEYHTVSYMTYDYYGRPVPQYYSIFDGYRYTNALIAAFNLNGEVLWSNMFDLIKIISFSLKQRLNYFFDQDDIILTYTEDGQIVSKIINGEDDVGELDQSDIATLHNNDEIISDERSEMERWYDNYFITYGYQTIKNVFYSGDRKRKVFYVNKIAFQ